MCRQLAQSNYFKIPLTDYLTIVSTIYRIALQCSPLSLAFAQQLPHHSLGSFFLISSFATTTRLHTTTLGGNTKWGLRQTPIINRYFEQSMLVAEIKQRFCSTDFKTCFCIAFWVKLLYFIAIITQS